MIKQLLEQLLPVQKKQLMYAFEQEIAQYIKLDDDIFVGVNVTFLTNLIIEEESGVWACGRLL